MSIEKQNNIFIVLKVSTFLFTYGIITFVDINNFKGFIDMISKEYILNQLEHFKFSQGKPVIVHSSVKSVGEIEGGAETLLSALIDFFTKDGGILCIPSHTWGVRDEKNRAVLDLNKNDSCTGILSKLAAAHPDGTRTLNPTHSMVVFGDKENVCEFIKGEDSVNTPTSKNGCYSRFYKDNGYVLLIGVGHNKNTYLHCVEEMLGVTKRYTKKPEEKTLTVFKDGTQTERTVFTFDESEVRDVSVFFPKFEPAFRYYNCITDGFLGNAPTQLCSAVKMKEVMELIYERANGAELLFDDLPLKDELYK